jgi:hypothetical protein
MSKAKSEAVNAIGAVLVFLFPVSCVRAALRDSIVGDFGCWFWISVDGLTAARRHQLRSVFTA